MGSSADDLRFLGGLTGSKRREWRGDEGGELAEEQRSNARCPGCLIRNGMERKMGVGVKRCSSPLLKALDAPVPTGSSACIGAS